MLIPLDEMNRRLAEALAGRTLPTERVPARQAATRVLGADATSGVDLPPFDKAAVDGFALLPGEQQAEYRVLGTIAAGQATSYTLVPGTTVKVMTGAPVPSGAGRVVMQEHVEERDGAIRLTRADRATNICRAGEDVRRGDVILRAGARLGALELANLVACGITEVTVVRRARLAVISTGDELVGSPEELSPGKIIDANGPMLEALAAAHGLEVVLATRVPDQRAATARAIRAGVEVADVVVLSGGISVGQFDYVHDALEGLGMRELFAGVAVKPGRPLTCALTASGKLVVALPGNPVAVFLMFHLCLLRVAALLSGADPAPREREVVLARELARDKGARQDYVPARVSPDGTAEPVEFHGSAHLAALMQADGFLIIPPGPLAFPAGGRVGFLPIQRS